MEVAMRVVAMIVKSAYSCLDTTLECWRQWMAEAALYARNASPICLPYVETAQHDVGCTMINPEHLCVNLHSVQRDHESLVDTICVHCNECDLHCSRQASSSATGRMYVIRNRVDELLTWVAGAASVLQCEHHPVFRASLENT